MLSKSYALLYFLLLLVLPCPAAEPQAEVVSFQSGEIVLHGTLYKPEGKGPFPAVVYNHGSAPGRLSKQVSKHWDQFLQSTDGYSSGLTGEARASALPQVHTSEIKSLMLRKRVAFVQVPRPWFGYWRRII